ncbi:MAG: D-alanyl-D-alanine carboxypeptidase family protein [Clostridia bacterium]|nr:D-alanyl-D-alanine carboxypeptidase family protein [Clostridia bacterium]
MAKKSVRAIIYCIMTFFVLICAFTFSSAANTQTEHTPVVSTVPATTKKNGKQTTKCKKCGKVLKTKTIYAAKASLPYPVVIYSGESRKPAVSVKDSKGKKISTDNYTVSYPKNIKMPGKYTITVKFKNKYAGTKSLTFEIRSQKTEITSAVTDDSLVKLKWKKSRGATGYAVYMSDTANGEYKKIKMTAENTYTKKKLVNGQKYYFKVKSYIKTSDGKRHYSVFSQRVGIKVKKAVKITLNKSAVTMNVGTVLTLKSTTYPSKVTVKWSSSNKNAATVKNGKIYAMNAGTSVITGYFTYKDVKYKANCTVKVKGKYATDMNGEKYAVIEPKNSEKWYLIVVNRTRRVKEDYMPSLKSILPSIYYDQELDSRVAPYYEKMYYDAKKDGITLAPYSAFRYYSGQKRNYLNRISLWQSYGYSKSQAIEKTVEVIMAPGGSEHNLGLAVDINGTDYDFDNTAAYRWLHAHAHNYGFIQRYPEGKSNITGVVCEPWHWRYVGKTAATEMHGTSLCLEEYLDKKGIAY